MELLRKFQWEWLSSSPIIINTPNIKYTASYFLASHPLAPNEQPTTAEYLNLLRGDKINSHIVEQ